MSIDPLDTMDSSQLLLEIGRLILTDSRYRDGDWRAVSFIIAQEPGMGSVEAYIYPEKGAPPVASVPAEFSHEIDQTAKMLQKRMAERNGTTWIKMLYQVWMPGPAFAATFENEDAERWKLLDYSAAGVRQLAESVDPAVTRGKS